LLGIYWGKNHVTFNLNRSFEFNCRFVEKVFYKKEKKKKKKKKKKRRKKRLKRGGKV